MMMAMMMEDDDGDAGDDDGDGDDGDDDDDDHTQWWNSVKEDRLLRPGPGPDQVRPVAVGVLASIQIPCWYITNTMQI